MVNKLRTLFFFLLIFFIFPQTAHASELPVVIINQVRGDEVCCQKGNSQLTDGIRNDESLKNIPMGWALRYDAMKNGQMVKWSNSQNDLGLLLEITPQLASESGVAYRGKMDGSDWYQAKNSMLIGYTQDERKKMIDKIMNEFYSAFNYYPKFTVSWMIDGWSLNYLEKKYLVKLHEITKEQFETDSYTLDGGLFNAGYYPSVNYPLMPGTDNNKLNIVIVRQTISDLLKNYGSQQTYYTSQPNDYLSDPQKKGTEYFNSLLSQLEEQSAKQKVAILGFENSYDWSKYGNEYLNQIREIKKQSDSKKITVLNPSQYADSFLKTNSQNKPFYFSYQFTNSATTGVLWYFGKTYRVRILLRENDLVLDDIRLFNQSPDPYNIDPSRFDFAYWIIPYVWNGSQMYRVSDQQIQGLKKSKIEGNSVSDLYTDPFGIIIPRSKFKIEGDDQNLSLSFSKDQTINFKPENFTISNTISAKFPSPINTYLSDLFYNTKSNSFYFKNHPSFHIESNKNSVNIGWKIEKIFVPLLNLLKDTDQITLTPQTSLQNLEELNPIFQPDKANLEVDSYKSIFYWNNKKAIAGRNPIRLFILPLNVYGRTTPVASISVNLSPEIENIKVDYPSDYSYRVTPWFVDISGSKPFKTQVSIVINGIEMVSNVPVEMVLDCSKKAVYCITHPGEGLNYFLARLDELKRILH